MGQRLSLLDCTDSVEMVVQLRCQIENEPFECKYEFDYQRGPNRLKSAMTHYLGDKNGDGFGIGESVLEKDWNRIECCVWCQQATTGQSTLSVSPS